MKAAFDSITQAYRLAEAAGVGGQSLSVYPSHYRIVTCDKVDDKYGNGLKFSRTKKIEIVNAAE